MRKIDLGCGNNKREGYIGIDKYPYPSVDVVRNIDLHGLPFDDSSIDEVYTSHFLEHCRDLVFVMNEIQRVLKPEGRVTIVVPNIMHSGAFRDPTHVRFFNEESFLYFTRHEWVYDGLQIKPFKLIEQKSNVEEINVILEKSCPELVSGKEVIKHGTAKYFLVLQSRFNGCCEDGGERVGWELCCHYHWHRFSRACARVHRYRGK